MSATESFLSQIPHEAVKEITDQLDDFENLIDPLIIYPLEETLSDLTVLQQGRMNTLVPLLLARLTKVYLRLNGHNPRDHPVWKEYERILAYGKKLDDLDQTESQRRMKLDKAVASRFIKSAITSLGLIDVPPMAKVFGDDNEDNEENETGAEAGPSSGSSSKPRPKADTGVIGSHLRFEISGAATTEEAAAKIAARKKAAEDESSEDEDLKVIDDEEEEEEDESKTPVGKKPNTGSPLPPSVSAAAQDPEAGPSNSVTGKRKRPAIDPFTGYGVDSPAPSSTSSSRRRKGKGKANDLARAASSLLPQSKQSNPNSGSSTPTPGTPAAEDDEGAEGEEGGEKEKLERKKRRTRKKKTKSSLLGGAASEGAGTSTNTSARGTPMDTGESDN